MAEIALDAGVLREDLAPVGASKLFVYLWKSAWEHAPATLEGDAEALHDMRVNLRRLRTAMQGFEGPKTAPVLSKNLRLELRGARVDIGKLGDRLGAVRDFDVLEDYVSLYAKDKLREPLENFPGLLGFVAYLDSARQNAWKPMLKTLKRAGEEGGLREEFTRWALGIPGANASGISVETAARVILPRYLEAVTAHAGSLGEGGEEEEQHELRKSLRRVRYALETLSVCFDKPVKPFVKRLVEMQDALGEMQDRTVLLEHTRSCFGKELPEDVAAFVEHGERRRRHQLGKVRAAWAKSEKDGVWDELRKI